MMVIFFVGWFPKSCNFITIIFLAFSKAKTREFSVSKHTDEKQRKQSKPPFENTEAPWCGRECSQQWNGAMLLCQQHQCIPSLRQGPLS